MSVSPDCDVAIVGAGPVGVLLANLLGRAGLSVVIVECEREIHPLPRAVHFDGEVMRAFQAAGLAEAVARVSRASSKGMHFVSASGQTLLIRRGHDGEGPQGWARNYYVHQPHLEAVLRDGLRRFPDVTLRGGAEVTAIVEDADGASLTIADRVTGAACHVRAHYIVGCDGARSLVRRTIGSASRDLGLHQAWLVVDALVAPDVAAERGFADHTIQLCDPARPMTIVYVGGERRRFEIMLMPGDDPVSITAPDTVWRLVARWLGPGDATLERAAVYTFHSVIAEGWRRGRLLLAGDACHQTPPFLGQGMCAGLRDAMNLAWKLASVVHGRAGDALLDTYERERRPHVEAFIRLAVELGALIQATDPAAARERDRRFAEGAVVFDFPEPQLGPGVRLDAPPPVGGIFPQPRLDDGRRLDDVTGGGFALVTGPEFIAGLTPDLRCRLAHHGIAIVDQPSRAITEWLVANGGSAALIRPDAYIAATLSTVADLSASLRALERDIGRKLGMS